jgi:hypothetical protein
MAGRGPAGKEPDKRARRNKEPAPLFVLPATPVEQPELPTFEIEVDGELREFRWPARTQQWWEMWGESPLTKNFTANDWSELLDTAMLHARFWRGDTKVAGELRLRTAKFGATPEDRLRLRIMFNMAGDEPDQPGKDKPEDPPQYRGLRLAD